MTFRLYSYWDIKSIYYISLLQQLIHIYNHFNFCIIPLIDDKDERGNVKIYVLKFFKYDRILPKYNKNLRITHMIKEIYWIKVELSSKIKNPQKFVSEGL